MKPITPPHHNNKGTTTHIYAVDEICPICGNYIPDGEICAECLKEHNLYQPKIDLW